MGRKATLRFRMSLIFLIQRLRRLGAYLLPSCNPFNYLTYLTLCYSILCPMLACSARDLAPDSSTVGRRAVSMETPVNQMLTPAGIQAQLPGVRPQALALSPDGRLLVTSDRHIPCFPPQSRPGKFPAQIPLNRQKSLL